MWHSVFRLLFPYSFFLLFGIINVDEVGFEINFIRSQIIEDSPHLRIAISGCDDLIV